MRNAALNLMTFHPEFDKHHSERALSHGVFIQTLLLRETRGLTEFPEGWQVHLDEFSALARTLVDLDRPALAAYARVLKAERDTKKKGKEQRCGQ